jgi:hypothetical protein
MALPAVLEEYLVSDEILAPSSYRLAFKKMYNAVPRVEDGVNPGGGCAHQFPKCSKCDP